MISSQQQCYNIIHNETKVIKNRVSQNYFNKYYPDLFKIILNKYFNTQFNIALYCFVNNINEIPKCKSCGTSFNNHKKFSFTNGFPEYCSIQCLHNSKEVKEKRNKTNLIKYGHENVFQSKVIKEKIKETVIEKYGVEFIGQSEAVKNKMYSVKVNKYGDGYFNNVNKIIKTNLEKYGVKTTLLNEETKIK